MANEDQPKPTQRTEIFTPLGDDAAAAPAATPPVPSPGFALPPEAAGPEVDPPDPLVGTLVLGKWKVLQKLGAGSFGTVYKVEDVKGGWVEALKVLGVDRLTGADAENMRKRFLREAQIMKRLGTQSQHIVGLSTYDEDIASGLIFFAMEYVQGKSLADTVIDGGPWSVERTIKVALQVCEALMAAHEGPEGVVHRDLKLENLMLTKDRAGGDFVKVLDFGIAKIVEREQDSRLTGAGALGTPGYAAPEQLRAGDVDGRTDLFAFGVILYALLTGRDPWLGLPAGQPTTQTYELMVATDRAEVKPMAGTGVKVPAGMESIVLQLMRRNPDERFQSARELKAALEALASGKEVARATKKGTTPVTSPVPADGSAAPAKRGRGVAVAVAVGVVALVGGGVFVAHPWGTTLDVAGLSSQAQAGNVASARLTEGGIAGLLSRGPLPKVAYQVPLPPEGIAGAVAELSAAGVRVDASLEVGRLITRAASAQAVAHYYGYDGDDVRGYAERAAALDPASGEAKSLLKKVAERMSWDADAAREGGNADRARELTDQCLALVPDHPRCLASRGGA